MKLATFRIPDHGVHLGTVIDDGRSLAALQIGAEIMEGAPSPHFTDMLTFIRDGPSARYKAHMVTDYVARQRPRGAIWSLQHVELLAPVPVPESIRDAIAFEAHVINATRAALGRVGRIDQRLEGMLGRRASLAYWLNMEWYKRPLYYKGNRFSVVGHNAEIAVPGYARNLDYELEWGVFIGKGGHDIAPKDARNHIAGYAIFNDFSARDVQLQEMRGRLGPAKGKDFDAGNAIGPWLVTPDEIPDPYALTMTARVNGEEWSRGTTADMHWTFEQIIAYISRSETLHPGEFIGSGTCSGAQGKGCGLELGRRLKPGDVVELEVQHIGTLRNSIAGKPTPSGVTVARPPATAVR